MNTVNNTFSNIVMLYLLDDLIIIYSYNMCIQTRSGSKRVHLQSMGGHVTMLSKSKGSHSKNKIEQMKEEMYTYTTRSNIISYLLSVCLYLFLFLSFMFGITWNIVPTFTINGKLSRISYIMNYAIYGCSDNLKTIHRIVLAYLSFNLIPSCASAHKIIEKTIVFLIQITAGSFVGAATLQKFTPYIWYSIRINIMRAIGQKRRAYFKNI